MGEKELQLGVISIIAATFFLFSGLDLFSFQLIREGTPGISVLLSFVLVAIGVYLLAKK